MTSKAQTVVPGTPIQSVDIVCVECHYRVSVDSRRPTNSRCPGCAGDKQEMFWMRPIIQDFANAINAAKRKVVSNAE